MRIVAIITGIIILAILLQPASKGADMNFRQLTADEERVIVHRGTERPFTGDLLNNKENGTYSCKRCGADLYTSKHKFESGCGWPAFDDEIPGAVSRKPDPDGSRVEIVCAKCSGHLGHVFTGEGLTAKNIRHCVNSISMIFKPASSVAEKDSPALNEAIFAAGCFWGVEHLMKKTPGVISTAVGYTGGRSENPDYRSVCSGTTGHIEAISVKFDPAKVTYSDLARLFFEIHDFSQENGQGPDIGEQYLSVIFYTDDNQKSEAESLIDLLREKGHKVATLLRPAAKFWPAEDYHQDYYEKTGKSPYCHIRRKIF